MQLYICDRKNKTELLDTLRVYLESGGNAAEAAKKLFILMSYTFVELLNIQPVEQEE